MQIQKIDGANAECWDAAAGAGAYEMMRENDGWAPFRTSYFVVTDGDATLAGVRLGHTAGLDVLRNYFEHDARARTLVVEELIDNLSGELLIWNDGETAPLRSGLEEAGCRLCREKVFVERPLDAIDEPQTSLRFVPLEALGEARFVELLESVATGDPYLGEDHRPGDEHFAELVRDAGSAWDPREWFVAMQYDRPVGVVMPQLYPDDPHGTILYMGVVPERRGRGHGTLLHAYGLWRLKQAGATSYVGSTDERSTGMLRVFTKNGCLETKRQFFYRCPPR